MCMVCQAALTIAAAVTATVPGVGAQQTEPVQSVAPVAELVVDSPKGHTAASLTGKCMRVGQSRTVKGVRYVCSASKRWVAKAAGASRGVSTAVASTSTTATVASTSTTATSIFAVPARHIPGPREIHEFGPGMDESSKDFVRKWIAYGVAYQEAVFGVTIDNFKISTSSDPAWLAQRDCSNSRYPGWADCVASRTALNERGWAYAGCIQISDCYVVNSWKNFAGTSWFSAETLAHEVHHVLQYQLHKLYDSAGTSSSQVRPTGPAWLGEGAASVIGAEVVIAAGYISRTARIERWKTDTRLIRQNLSGFETYDGAAGFVNVYSLYALATAELTERSPNGLKSLGDYYRGLADGLAWREAFRRSFGTTVEDFYVYFEKTRN